MRKVLLALVPVFATIALLEGFRGAGIELPGGVLHIVGIAIAALVGGFPAALIASLPAVAHGYLYLTAPGHDFQIRVAGVVRANVLLVAGPVLAIVAGLLKRRTETALAALAESNRQLSQEIAAKTALEAEHRVLLEEQQRFAEDMLALGEMSSTLQVCDTNEEAATLLSRSLGALFSEASGAVYLLAPELDRAASLATWGAGDHSPEFSFDGCWALRRMRPHRTHAGASEPPCPHAPAAVDGLCFPLTGKGGLIGVLHVATARRGPEADRVANLARIVSDDLALGLENLALRQRLTLQALRDPLTGLLNRRAMLDVLDREVRRAERKDRPLSVLLLDVDHFKTYNDTHGHAAGDVALREFGRHIQTFFRADDETCRYGGEEFVVILPETDLAHATTRAEAFRKTVESLPLSLGDERLPGVTVSIGVATFPTHAPTIEALLRRADEALYRAKRGGRNRVCWGGSGEFDAGRSPDSLRHVRR